MAARRDRVDVTKDSKNDEIEIAIRVHSLVTNSNTIDIHVGVNRRGRGCYGPVS